MQIKNIGQDARTLSREGFDVPLLPGASVDYPLTEKEADAYRCLGFEVTGDATSTKPKSKQE